MCSKNGVSSNHMSGCVMVDFGFYLTSEHTRPILFSLYKDMIFNQSVDLADLKWYADEGLLQELIDKTYPSTKESLQKLVCRWLGFDIASIVALYVAPTAWADFCRLRMFVRKW